MVDTSEWIKCEKCKVLRPQAQYPIGTSASKPYGHRLHRCLFCIPQFQERFRRADFGPLPKNIKKRKTYAEVYLFGLTAQERQERLRQIYANQRNKEQVQDEE